MSRSGIRPIRQFDTLALPVHFAGEIDNFDPRNYLDRKERKRLNIMPRTIQLAVAAAQLAMDDSQIDPRKIDPRRFGVEFGAGTISGELVELGPAARLSSNGVPRSVDLQKWGEQGLASIPPTWMLNHVPNMPACHISILHDARGPNNSVTQTDAASLLALGEAYRIVARGNADLMLVGGADSKLNPVGMVRQCLFSPLSRRNDAPAEACRPFELRRDGIVLGEGAGVFLLEEYEHACRRGARIYGEVVGFGATFDKGRTGHGLARAIERALAEARLGVADLDHINAHGYSAVDLDIWEARGIGEVIGEKCRSIPVFAPKSYFGNLSAGSGTTELAASLLALEHNLLPATLNYEIPDPECALNVSRDLQPVTSPSFLKVGLTELGQCVAIVCKKVND
jgi:3-oxoacyl-[acyl-carrier-protein] synthase II